jgi:hypothetical protein
MYSCILKPARISPKQKEEQAEDSFPRPLPPPLATSESRKKESAEVLRNPFPRKLFPQNFVRIVSDFFVGIAFKKGSNFVQ